MIEQPLDIKSLELKADEIRMDIITMLTHAGSGHSAGPLGMADIFTALYFGGLMSYNAKIPTGQTAIVWCLAMGTLTLYYMLQWHMRVILRVAS